MNDDLGRYATGGDRGHVTIKYGGDTHAKKVATVPGVYTGRNQSSGGGLSDEVSTIEKQVPVSISQQSVKVIVAKIQRK